MRTWFDIEPDERMVRCLDVAGPRPLDGTRNDKKRWSEVFADACAVMVANALRGQRLVADLSIKPLADGSGRESITPLGSATSKKLDVTAVDPLLGLQLGVSLKATNFADRSRGNYDKNLTGRLYELREEMSVVHEYLPRAFMAGLFFVPLGGTSDKKTAASSFARTVRELRGRTGRFDQTLPTLWPRCDWSVVGLYSAADPGDPLARGVVRYFDTTTDPPKLGRPKLDATFDLDAFVEQLVAMASGVDQAIEWSLPEEDPR